MLDLTAAGLTETEAKMYSALLSRPEWKPAELAAYVKESRTNCYKILDNLVAKKLAERFDKDKKLHYRGVNPARLFELAREERARRETAERALEASSEELMQSYFQTNEQPGVRFYQGKDDIRRVFEDMLQTKEDIYLVRSPADVEFYDDDFFEDFKKHRSELGITTYALTPDVPSATHDSATDQANRFLRTWLPSDAYTGSVEWNIYGNKLAIISYGQEAIAMVVESRQIAHSFRQLFELVSAAHSSPAK